MSCHRQAGKQQYNNCSVAKSCFFPEKYNKVNKRVAPNSHSQVSVLTAQSLVLLRNGVQKSKSV